MELCLISKEPMEHPLRLPCNHSFEYIYLYYEIIEQKKTSSKGFKCPYCRVYYEQNIPYYEIDEIEKKSNVNYKKTLSILKCGECDQPAHKYKHGDFCIKHSKIKCKGICKNGQPCNHKASDGFFCKLHKI